MPRPRAHGRTTKRGAILEAAVDLLIANGYERTSMDAVAATAGVAKSTVYAHFPEKLELFKAVMTEAGAEVLVDLDTVLARSEDASAQEQLVAVLTRTARAATAPHFLAYLRWLITETEHRQALIESFEEAQAELPDIVQVVADLIAADAERAGYAVEDPSRYARTLLRCVTPTLQLDKLVSEFHPDDDLIAAHVRFVVDVFLNGMRPRGTADAALPHPALDYPWVSVLYRS